MSAERSHERFEELAVGHALAALEPEDEQTFLLHLRGCAACERAVAGNIETLAHLAYAAEPAPLPASLLAGIRTGMRASGRPMTSATTAVAAPVNLEAVRARRRGRFDARRMTAAAAAAAAILSLGVWNASLQHGKSATEARSQRLASAVRLLESGATRQVPLSDGRGHSIAVAVMHGNQRVSLVIDGLPPNDPSHNTYVLWQTGDSGTKPVGTFDVTGNGVAVVRNLALVKGLNGCDSNPPLRSDTAEARAPSARATAHRSRSFARRLAGPSDFP